MLVHFSQITLDLDMRKPDDTSRWTKAFSAEEGYRIHTDGILVYITGSEKRTGVEHTRVCSATRIVDAHVLPTPQAEAKRPAARAEKPAA